MSLAVENLEHSMAKLTITVPAEEFGKAMTTAYNKQKGKFNVPGFRKGHVPQAFIEKMYGPAVFYEEAANSLINEYYPKEVSASDVDVVSRPVIDVTQIEKGKDFIFTAEVAVKPEVELGDYKGLEVEKADVEVTDDEVMAELLKVQKENSRYNPVTDRAAQMDDEVTLDFEGSVDGVPFEGGKAENCKIKEIKAVELPELDDEFASEVSDFETLDEYKEDIKSKAAEKKQKDAENEKENKLIEKVIENAKMDVADAQVADVQERIKDEFSQNLQYQGINLEQYMQICNITEEALMERIKPDAEKRIKSRLVLEAIAAAENIEVSDDEVHEELEAMAKQYQMNVEDIEGFMGDAEKDSIKKDLAVKKAVKVVVDNAKEV